MYDDWEELKRTCHIIKKPFKYTTMKGELQALLNELTTLEKVVYCAYQVCSLREIATVTSIPKDTVNRLYVKAYAKVKQAKLCQNETLRHKGDEGFVS